MASETDIRLGFQGWESAWEVPASWARRDSRERRPRHQRPAPCFSCRALSHVLRGGRSCMGSGRHVLADAAAGTCGHPRERPRPQCASVKGVGRCHQRPLHARSGDRALGDGVQGGWVRRWGCEATPAEEAGCYTRATVQFLRHDCGGRTREDWEEPQRPPVGS